MLHRNILTPPPHQILDKPGLGSRAQPQAREFAWEKPKSSKDIGSDEHQLQGSEYPPHAV